MKKALCFILSNVLILCLCVGLISCDLVKNHFDNNSSNENPSSENPENKPFSVDLEGYVANIENATALGISKNTKPVASTVGFDIHSTKKASRASYTNTKLTSDSENKNYLVMSTSDYDGNRFDTNATVLSKVTFSKITTENATSEITGTKYIVAKNGKITINANNGFEYSISLNDEILETVIADNGDPNKPNKKIFITFDNLIDGVEYKIQYRGIGTETTVTQDELKGEIDKLCVINGYTFISFVPVGTSERPSDSELEYDYDGIAIYDKNLYYSDAVRQSFIVDNSTGYIYPLNDFMIFEIKNGLIYSFEGKYFDINVEDTGELNFVQIVRNETLHIYSAFKDKYGNKYVQNDYLDGYDEENRTVYYTKTNYLLSREGVAIHIEYTDGFGYNSFPENFTVINKINEDFTSTPISKSEAYDFSYHYSDVIDQDSSIFFSHIENGYFYMYATQGGAYSYFARVNTESKFTEYNMYGVYGYDGGWKYNCLKSSPVDHDTVLIWCDWSGTPKLYYADVWGDNAFIEDGNMYDSFDDNNLTVLLENIVCEPNWAFNHTLFRYTTFTETVYYKIITDANGIPIAINSETYVAPEQEIVTLQPINK